MGDFCHHRGDEQFPSGIHAEDVNVGAGQHYLPGGEPALGITGSLPVGAKQQQHREAAQDDGETDNPGFTEFAAREGEPSRSADDQSEEGEGSVGGGR